MVEAKHNSPSRRALDHLLDEESPEAIAVRENPKLHRTMLWRYRTGKGRPDANTIALLDQLSRGRVPATGWVDDEKPRRAVATEGGPAPNPGDPATARTDPKFDGGRSDHPPWAPEDADSNPSGPSNPEANDAA